MIKDLLKLAVGSGLTVLNEFSVALGHSPGIRLGHARAVWEASAGLQGLPVVLPGPERQ